MADFHYSLLRENANDGLRIAAATSLAKMGQIPRLLEFVEITHGKATHKIMQNILEGIKKSEAPGATEVLIALTKHSHFRVREYSVKSLAYLGDLAVSVLALAIDDVDRPEWAEAKPNI